MRPTMEKPLHQIEMKDGGGQFRCIVCAQEWPFNPLMFKASSDPERQQLAFCEQPQTLPQGVTPEMAEAIRVYFTDLAAGRCPTCQQPIIEQQQVGRCVYALPCQHRLYQGQAKPKPEKTWRDHPYFNGG